MRTRSWKTGYPSGGQIWPKEYKRWSKNHTNGEIIAYVLLGLFVLCGVYGAIVG